MARNRGMFNFSSNYEMLTKSPLDARQLVGLYSDLTGDTWLDISSNSWLYDGAIVSVSSDPTETRNGLYRLKSASGYTSHSNWVKMLDSVNGNGSGLTDIPISGVTGLQTALGSKSGTDHTHSYLPLSGGTLTGNLYVTGDIIQSGTTWETHANKIYTSGDTITLRDGAVGALNPGEYVGIIAKKYNNVNDGVLVFDKNGVARVGDMDTVNWTGTTQPLATREESPLSDGIAVWNSGQTRFDTISKATLPVSTATQTALDSKSDTGHTHPNVYEPANANIQTHIISTSNPHGTTAAQVGAYGSGRTDELLLTKSDTGHTHPGVYLPITGGTLNGNLSGTTFYGSGAGLTNIPASGVTDLNLSQISSSGVTASVSSSGLTVNSGATFNGDITSSGYLTSLNISGTSINTGDERYTNTTSTPETIHGIPSGSTFNNKTVKEMFDLLLYPELFPSVLGITNTFTISLNSLYEIGSVVAGTTTASFNRGSITPAYGTDGFRSGPPIQYNYTGTGLTTTASTAITNVQSITGLVISTGNTSWTSTVTYSAGQQPLSSKGNPHPLYSALVSGTTSPVITKTVEGVYPIFATTSDITGLTKQPLVTMLNSSSLTGITLSLVSESGGNKQKFELPSAWVGAPTNKPLVGVQVFNTNSNTFDYYGGSAALSLTLWTVTDVTETVQGNTVGYKRYTFNGADRGPVILNLKFQ